MKVLIYMAHNTLKPSGGPRGYLYNLENGWQQIAKNHNDIEIHYLPDSGKEQYHKYFDKMPKFLKRKYLDLRMRKQCKFLIDENQLHKTTIDLNQYDAVHFHSSLVLASVRDSLKDYKGKVLLTNHSPKPLFREWIEDTISKKEYERSKDDFDKLSEIEELSYDSADYIIFPCEEAEEPCINNWPIYNKIKKKNKSKYRYMLTGVNRPAAKLSREEVCKKYNIPQDAIIISYVGRHNSTKGYDCLTEIGKKVLEKYSNIYFLIAGKEEPLKGLNHRRWIEAGWINDPGTYYAAADIFVLPNKETYFDLVMLEALSSSTVILATRTGGNKVFDQYNSDGIKLYNDSQEAIKLIDELVAQGREALKHLGACNKNIYEEHYTVKKFAEHYVELLRNIRRT